MLLIDAILNVLFFFFFGHLRVVLHFGFEVSYDRRDAPSFIHHF